MLKNFSLAVFVFAFVIFFPCSVRPIMAAETISQDFSNIRADKVTATANGIDRVRVSVTVKNTNLLGLKDLEVTLESSRGLMDEVSPQTTKTSLTGVATFYVNSLKNGSAIITPIINGERLNKSVTITFENGIALALNVGDLIKIPNDNNESTQPDSAVYYYASNGRRYVFPNEKVYFSWNTDFQRVKEIPIDQMSLIPIGGNITYRPGSKFVKFQTDTKTYLPTKGGVLRWVQTEDVARSLFGPQWNQQVDDISEAFYVNYKFGTPIANSLDISLPIIQTSVNSINSHLGLGAP